MGASPLTSSRLIDEYFIENRTKLLDIAAYLDRLDRAGGPGVDFRMEAFAAAVDALRASGSSGPSGSSRIERVQLIFSDPTTEPRQALDRKSASGAFDSRQEAR
jgi:hypothetical protein